MKIEDKLTFCQVCSNRNYNLENGTFCGLTNQKPTFETWCPDYNEDSKARREKEKGLLSRVTYDQIEENYNYPTNQKAIQKLLKQLPNSIVVRRSKLDAWTMILIFPLITGIFLASFLAEEKGTENLFSQPLGYLLLVPITGISIYGIYLLKNNSPKLTLNLKSLILNEIGLTIPWWLILRTAIKSENAGSTTIDYLSLQVLGQSAEINYRLNSVNLSRRKLVTAIEAYREYSKKTCSNIV